MQGAQKFEGEMAYNKLMIGSMIFISVLFACQTDAALTATSLELPPTKQGAHYQVYIETPQGHAQLYQLNEGVGFDTLALGDPYHLPIPVNAGFIPVRSAEGESTRIRTWVIGKQMTSGDILGIRPVGLIKYQIAQEKHQDILAVPASEVLQTIAVPHFRSLITNFDPVKYNFEYWLRHHQGVGKLTQLSWDDEEEALSYLNTFQSISQ